MKAETILLTLLPMAASTPAASPPLNARIERFDTAFDALVAPDARIERLAEGFTWSEGPIWINGGLVFSDVPENTAYRWEEGMTGVKVFLKPSGLLTPRPGFREPGSNGLTRDAQGRLLLCQHGERRVARLENGTFTSLADRFEGRRFNSPNDLVLRRDGSLYFTDPPYGLEGINDSPLREIPFSGVYRIGTDGKVSLLERELTFPNGIAFSPDEKILYVGVSDAQATRIVAYDVRPDGTIANGRTFFDAQPLLKGGDKGLVDGMKLDRDGNLWSSGPGGILVISPSGRLLGRINTGVAAANCNWGDDGGTLYITAHMFLLRVRTLSKGAGW